MPDRPVTFATDTPRVRTIARWLTFGVVALILYGSLFPFGFDASLARDLLALITGLHFAGTSRGDVVANLLLYLPLGLVLMIATSLLPIGIIQFHAIVSEGLWYARSEAFMQQEILQTLRWVRSFGDVVFIVGALAMAWQVVSGFFSPTTSTVPQRAEGERLLVN